MIIFHSDQFLERTGQELVAGDCRSPHCSQEIVCGTALAWAPCCMDRAWRQPLPSLPSNASLEPAGIRSFLPSAFQLFHKFNLNPRLRAQGLWETDEQRKAGISNNPATIKIWQLFLFCKPSISNPENNPWGPAETLNHGVMKHIFKKKKKLSSLHIRQETTSFNQTFHRLFVPNVGH